MTRTIPYRQGGVDLQGYLTYDDVLQGKPPVFLLSTNGGVSSNLRGHLLLIDQCADQEARKETYGKTNRCFTWKSEKKGQQQ